MELRTENGREKNVATKNRKAKLKAQELGITVQLLVYFQQGGWCRLEARECIHIYIYVCIYIYIYMIIYTPRR